MTEQKIKLVKNPPKSDFTPKIDTPKPTESIINIPPKKNLIKPNSPIIERIKKDEEKASRESLDNDELIELEFKEQADAIRAKVIKSDDIKDYMNHSKTPETRNNAEELEDFSADENDILDDNIMRTPLPQRDNVPNMPPKPIFDDRIDLSDLMPNPPKKMPQNSPQTLRTSPQMPHYPQHTQQTQQKGSLGLIKESHLDSNHKNIHNNTPNIINDFATADNSDTIVGIYTPDPQDLDDKRHHSVEFVDKIDNYDIEIPKSNIVYDGGLDNNKNIDLVDDINALNAMRDSLKQREREIEEKIKAIKLRQQLGDIKSITSIDSESKVESRAESVTDSKDLKKLQDLQKSQDLEDSSEEIFLDFSQHSKPNPPQNPSYNDISLATRNEILGQQNNATTTQNTQDSKDLKPKDEFNEDFFNFATTTQNTTPTHYENPHTKSHNGTFALPPLSLLNPPLTQKIDIDDSEIDIKVQNLFNKLRVFKIEGDIVRTYSGPVVTTFEFRPAPNVKVSRIQNLQDDLSMALKATSIRIQAPIPGKDVVGIEIPNNKIQTIYLREIFESEEFRNSNANLPIALGKDVIGNPVIEDLSTLPHLLIAGTTGSGKSVGINAMILSLLYRHTPKELRFIMIDPKFLEFGLYKDIPHLLTPIITDPKKAIIALSKAVEEMNRRYELMDKAKVKTIVGFNKLAEASSDENKMEKLPYIVIIIDEFADLMIMGGREAEQFLISLAGKARASGIHLIIATQRPTVNVVTGLIKGNLPSKISYRVGSKIDSKVILDETGAEALLGRGDLLFSKTNIVRLHAPYNDEREIERVVEFLKSQQEVEYDEFFSLEQKEPTPQPTTQISSEGDYKERAKEIILQSGKTSISYLQRGLGIGFNKAANIIENLEKEGFLSPPNSKGIREIIG